MNTDARFWDNIAEKYAAKPFPKPEATARKMEITRGLLRPEHRLLDVGCATGTLPIQLAPHVAEVVGVDISSAMIGIAERRAAEAGARNIRFQVEAASTLESFADGSFDAVTALNILHLVPEPAVLLAAIHRVLRPGGVFVSSTVCLGGTWLPPYGLILPVLRWLGKAPSVNLMTAAELRVLIEQAGFQSIEAPDVGRIAPSAFLVARKGGT